MIGGMTPGPPPPLATLLVGDVPFYVENLADTDATPCKAPIFNLFFASCASAVTPSKKFN